MINKLYKSKYYPLAIQIIALVVFALLVFGAFGISTTDSTFAKQLRNTNLSNLIVWSYWWPLIVVTAVFFGRHWCSVCPIELITKLTSSVGLKRKVPHIIKSGWVITIFYAFVAIIGIHTLGVHRIPHLMALYLLSLVGLAIIVSLIFRKRAFCSYFCPVGKLLALYSMITNKGLRVKDKSVCKACKTKDCISKTNQNKLIGRSCTSDLYPANISDNRSCILCTQCVKSCTKNNIHFSKNGNSFQLFRFDKLKMSEVGMIMILLGFISYEIMSSWKISKGLLLSIPEHLYEILPLSFLPFGTYEAIVLMIILPIIFVFLISFVAKQTGKKSWSFYIKHTVGFLLPVVAFGHVFKALLKTSSRLPYWQYALSKPDGMLYADKIVNKQIIIGLSNWFELIIIVLGLFGLLFGLYLTTKKLFNDKMLNISGKIVYLVAILFYFSLLFGSGVVGVFHF